MSQQIRKHTKTFSGCWTCRARKVKCDEAKPYCGQCRRKATQCEGYGVKLQWVNRNDNDDPETPLLLSPRSKITPDTNVPILPYSRVDQILNGLDSLDSRRNKRGTKVAVFVECFGVFGTREELPPTPSSQTNPLQSSINSSIETPREGNTSTSPVNELQEGISGLLSWGPFSLCDLDGNQILPFDLATTNFFGDIDNSPIVNYGDTRDSDIQVSLNYSHSMTATSFFLSPTPSFLSRNESFLMYHYSKRVLYIFSVVDHEKSPWKTIHLAKALQATGELTVQGSTSRIRSALTRTLLAISAFLFSNDNKLSHRDDEARNWRVAAENYRCKAVQLLRDAVENDFYCKSPPKYKEFLATTLSMITINVVSGDIKTCGIHLDGAFRLITHAQKWKRTYSPKAQSLHRIYFYLRTIYESTAPRRCRESRRLSLMAESHDLESSHQDDIFCRNLLDKQMLGYGPGLDLDFEPRISSSERIYGIPHSLLYLLTRVIDLIDKIQDATDAFSAGQVPGHFTSERDDIERSILDWPEAVGLEESVKGIDSPSAKIVHHHTLAFHNALIIYFAQHIPLVGHRFLQPYVTAVLESMEEIEVLKIGAETLAAPLYWPAFIAGSEAFDKGLQDRFRLWYEHVQVYRIEALRTGIEVLSDVWENGPSAGYRTTCYWRAVVERSDVRLMLS
ncbi:related to ARG81-Transcription factor involved in arginine metabolism [Fusarium oxysporum]|uniref:Related to ARG81-Transcription factor involved in arginine metabolism n=1 Tax=Fusarium oxysporum TaxID=5507 RepID=A0A2H3SSR7_FUSOX|nr:related to ARG81-Transcription factor involved in arginine metabolism [Fusarium oxysporum]